MLINLPGTPNESHAFCRKLRADPKTEAIAIVSVRQADSSRARFAALDAGADDVLARPISDTLLLARIPSLMHRRNLGRELSMRDGMNRIFGFDEPKSEKLTPSVITVLSSDKMNGQRLLADLKACIRATINLFTPGMTMLRSSAKAVPDLFVIDARNLPDTKTYQLIVDLKSQLKTRLSQQIIILPVGAVDAAAIVLDPDADDVAFADATADKLKLRMNALLQQKSGLMGCVTKSAAVCAMLSLNPSQAYISAAMPKRICTASLIRPAKRSALIQS